MKVFILVVALWGAPQLTFQIDADASCEDIARHPIVLQDYRKIFGNNVMLYCVEQ